MLNSSILRINQENFGRDKIGGGSSTGRSQDIGNVPRSQICDDKLIGKYSLCLSFSIQWMVVSIWKIRNNLLKVPQWTMSTHEQRFGTPQMKWVFLKVYKKRVQEKQSRSENGTIVVRAFGPDRKRKCRYILGKFSQCQLFLGCFPQREPVKIKCIGQKRWMVIMCQICSAFTACQIDRR